MPYDLSLYKFLLKMANFQEISELELVDMMQKLQEEFKYVFLSIFTLNYQDNDNDTIPNEDKEQYFINLIDLFFKHMNYNIQSEDELEYLKTMCLLYVYNYTNFLGDADKQKEYFELVEKILKNENQYDLEAVNKEYLYIYQELGYYLLWYYNQDANNFFNGSIASLINYLESIQEWHRSFIIDERV